MSTNSKSITRATRPYKLYWYGPGGQILGETDGAGNTLNDYVFLGGRRITMLPAGGNPILYVEDMLGTSRINTDNTGVVCYDADFYPYGGERVPYTDTCTQNFYKFEGKERDAETGNDDFGARYYSNRFGRWLSADWSNVPIAVPYANLSNPQTLNLYSMVGDDPESFADLDGHCQGMQFPNSPENECPQETANQNRETANANGINNQNTNRPSTQNQNTQPQSPDQLQLVNQAGADKKQGQIAEQINAATEPATDQGRLNAAKQGTQMAEPMINAGVKVVAGEAAITATVAVGSSPAAAAAAKAAKKNLKFDGPSAGFAYGDGRAFAIRWGKFTIVRVDLHPMSPASAGKPQWHIHLFSEGGEHGLRFPISW